VFIEATDDGSGSDNWSYKSCKANHHHQQTNIQVFTGRMPFLSPNQQCQSTEGKNITFHGLAYPSSPGGLPTLSLTTNNSWLLWGRVAMPLISPLMSVSCNLVGYLHLQICRKIPVDLVTSVKLKKSPQPPAIFTALSTRCLTLSQHAGQGQSVTLPDVSLTSSTPVQHGESDMVGLLQHSCTMTTNSIIMIIDDNKFNMVSAKLHIRVMVRLRVKRRFKVMRL